MFNTKATNADITQHDWAKRDRATLLRTLHTSRSRRAPAAASSVWGIDVAGCDPRSVRAHLVGRGDLRSAWWNMYSQIYLTVVPGSTLELVIYSFHSFHHALTLAKLRFLNSVKRTAADIERKGVFAAARSSIVREIKR